MKKTITILVVVLITKNIFAQVPSYVPTNSLTGWWSFTGNANDGSVNNNNGTVSGATLTTDRLGNPNSAYTFNGLSDTIIVPHSSSLVFATNKISVSLWANVFTHTSFGQMLISKQAGQGNSQVGFNVVDWPSHVQLLVNNGGSVPLGPLIPNISLNQWHHFAFVFDNGDCYGYYDRALADSTTVTNTLGLNTYDMLFGAPNWTAVGAFHYNGILDDIAIYDRSLSQCEINQLFSASSITISVQPVNAFVLNGNAATFFVNSTDTCLTYQWQQDCGTGFINLTNFGVYSGVNTDTLIINPVSFSVDNCAYRCILSSCFFCTDTSNAAVLNVSGVGISELDFDSYMNLFPNPFTDEINISSKNNVPLEIIIYDITSREILKRNFVTSISLNTKQIIKGIYFYEVRAQNGLSKKGKILKD